MHEPLELPCIFGCRNCDDEIRHYLLCSPLWQIASGAFDLQAPLHLETRLGLVDPSPETLQMLALAFMIYHNAKSRIKELGGLEAVGHRYVQQIAYESSRAFVTHLKKN